MIQVSHNGVTFFRNELYFYVNQLLRLLDNYISFLDLISSFTGIVERRDATGSLHVDVVSTFFLVHKERVIVVVRRLGTYVHNKLRNALDSRNFSAAVLSAGNL